ncbi:bifunctional hydroxymethylpyrimidine kinase/phosphomethylpyrimidine kinase [Jatrophihabitans cynanchi]|uniref:Bifunctional hydroxymethylpyrimidine kinase/phosphomethylpyrimidine kinase n=1 Tax=Jatrophihabitans cynanchi TaxID=2944128 RepID=A0ABY7K0Y8_9ACTN|nr:bifunctional hydroxymethylpyrimidine kinase/phosphomethylpyrimidine kinase [Jatrophihabitans sp. SB3-54]WAX57262.1 bifunctional hydroxymethylpyrimidine kinase/phosphomethylpyrimidine kinase [Jatrophihabitans sp. SB3-54]
MTLPGTVQPPTALTIAGSDSGGGAGAQADLKTFLSCHVHGMSAITAVTVQNSLGVTGFYELPPQAVAEQIESVATDIGVGAAKTGMLASAAIMDAVAEAVRRLKVTPLVVDPVAASQHGDPLLRPDALSALRKVILPLATLVTPNLGEVRLLTGLEVRERADMDEAAKALHALGPQWVLVKGGHLPGGDAVDVLYDGSTFAEFAAPRRTTEHTHGSGDTLAAAITAGLARGLDVPAAVELGKAFITGAVAGSFPLGAGLGPVGHFWRVKPWPAQA